MVGRVWPRCRALWPALYLEFRLVTWYTIVAGLVIEFLFLWRLMRIPPKRAAVVDFTMNLASSLLGVVLLPLIGFGYEFSVGALINDWRHTGTFNPVSWAFTCAIGVALSTSIEAVVIRWGFKIPLTRRNIGWLTAANAASVAVAFASLLISWPHL